MTKRELAALACKILALWVFYVCIRVLGYLILPFVGTPSGWTVEGVLRQIVLVVGPSLGVFVFALLLWKGADRLAGQMVDDDPTPIGFAKVDYSGLLTVAIMVLGVVLVTVAIASIISSVMSAALYRQIEKKELPLRGVEYGVELSQIINLLVGMWLILGTKRIVRFLGRARTMGLDKGPDEPSESQRNQKETDG